MASVVVLMLVAVVEKNAADLSPPTHMCVCMYVCLYKLTRHTVRKLGTNGSSTTRGCIKSQSDAIQLARLKMNAYETCLPLKAAAEPPFSRGGFGDDRRHYDHGCIGLFVFFVIKTRVLVRVRG